jgi:hypothetical protein
LRYLLAFYADEKEWMALPAEDRDMAVAEIGRWFGEQSAAGKIVGGHRLAPRGATKTVRHGRVRKKDLPSVVDGPFLETKESVGSYAIVEVKDEAEALEIAKSWPAGGAVEVRALAD